MILDNSNNDDDDDDDRKSFFSLIFSHQMWIENVKKYTGIKKGQWAFDEYQKIQMIKKISGQQQQQQKWFDLIWLSLKKNYDYNNNVCVWKKFEILHCLFEPNPTFMKNACYVLILFFVVYNTIGMADFVNLLFFLFGY